MVRLCALDIDNALPAQVGNGMYNVFFSTSKGMPVIPMFYEVLPGSESVWLLIRIKIDVMC